MNATNASRSRPDLYSSGLSLFPSNHFSVGNPVIPNLFPSALCWSASTFAMVTLSLAAANASPNCSYTGARFLQCPHHGAKNSTRAGLPDWRTMSSKLDGVRSTTLEARAAVAERMVVRMENRILVVQVGVG